MPDETKEPYSVPIELQLGAAHNSLWQMFPDATMIDIDLETPSYHNNHQPAFIWSARIAYMSRHNIVVKGETLGQLVINASMRRNHQLERPQSMAEATQLAPLRRLGTSHVTRN